MHSFGWIKGSAGRSLGANEYSKGTLWDRCCLLIVAAGTEAFPGGIQGEGIEFLACIDDVTLGLMGVKASTTRAIESASFPIPPRPWRYRRKSTFRWQKRSRSWQLSRSNHKRGMGDDGVASHSAPKSTR